MKRAILFAICLLFILPTTLFAEDEFKFQRIRFFEAGDDAPEASKRQYMVQFPKSSTRYVWTQVDVQNLLYNKREHTHKVVWRYYNPDETLRGEVSADFRIKTAWYNAWHQYGWGWSNPGNWPVGTYRVEVWIDGKKFGQDFFTIYDDRAVSPPVASSVEEKVYLEFEFVKFFEGGFTAPPASQRQYKTQFPRSTTRYVFFSVGAKNLLYKNRAQKPLVVGRYYNADGSFRGEGKVDVDVPSDWARVDLWNGWGADQPGNWPVGTYRVEILFSNKKVGEGSFTIYDDKVTPSPPVKPSVEEKVYLEFESVKFFEGATKAPPPSQRQYKKDFPISSTRYVYFFVGAKNLLYRNRSHKPTIFGRYYYPDGTFFGEAKLNVDIPSDWEEADLWTGWGWDEPGNWSLGTYRVEIFFGNMKAGEGTFTIYDDRK